MTENFADRATPRPIFGAMGAATDVDFYAAIPPFDRFEAVVDQASYRPLPDGWIVGTAVVVDSTGAIASDR
jgi:hypothetical protein